jgi:hypothetical protein
MNTESVHPPGTLLNFKGLTPHPVLLVDYLDNSDYVSLLIDKECIGLLVTRGALKIASIYREHVWKGSNWVPDIYNEVVAAQCLVSGEVQEVVFVKGEGARL